MPASTSVNSVLLDLQKIIDTWNANPAFSLNDYSQKRLLDIQTDTLHLSETIETRKTELQGLINQRNDRVKELQSIITRARSGVRAFFGPDSSQYDQVGGRRSSERKPRSRRVSAASLSTPK